MSATTTAAVMTSRTVPNGMPTVDRIGIWGRLHWTRTRDGTLGERHRLPPDRHR
jgi:hypothetical protein